MFDTIQDVINISLYLCKGTETQTQFYAEQGCYTTTLPALDTSTETIRIYAANIRPPQLGVSHRHLYFVDPHDKIYYLNIKEVGDSAQAVFDCLTQAGVNFNFAEAAPMLYELKHDYLGHDKPGPYFNTLPTSLSFCDNNIPIRRVRGNSLEAIFAGIHLDDTGSSPVSSTSPCSIRSLSPITPVRNLSVPQFNLSKATPISTAPGTKVATKEKPPSPTIG